MGAAFITIMLPGVLVLMEVMEAMEVSLMAMAEVMATPMDMASTRCTTQQCPTTELQLPWLPLLLWLLPQWLKKVLSKTPIDPKIIFSLRWKFVKNLNQKKKINDLDPYPFS